MNAAQVKFLVSLAMLLALWRVFEIPGVATAFWALITVGAIPGTDRVLGSDAMLRILCVLFAVSFFLVFRKEFMASLPKRSRRPSGAAVVKIVQRPAAEPPAEARPNPLERSVIILNKQKDRPALQLVRPLLVVLCFVLAGIVALVTRVEQVAERFMRAAARQMTRAALFVYRLARITGRQIYRYLFAAGRILVRAAIMLWHAAVPHIRAFDHWLDVQLHANAKTARMLRSLDTFGKASADTYRKAQDAKRKLLE